MASSQQHTWNGSQMGGDGTSAASFGMGHPLSDNNEARARDLRSWYRTGQAYFRGFVDKSKHLINLNDALQLIEERKLNSAEKDGFLMGWQSDVYAYEHNLDYAVEGMDNHIEENSYGFVTEDEGHEVLVSASIA